MSAQGALLSRERTARNPLADSELQGDVCLGAEDSTDDLSALRLVPVPDVGPPFDGELLADTVASLAAGQSILGPAESPDPVAVTAGIGRLESPGEWPRQFARLLAEALAGARPVRQMLPWTSERARGQLHRLMPLFGGGHRPRVLRVIATRPTREVIEMSVIVNVGSRTHALAIRLEHLAPRRHLSRHADRAGECARPDPSAVRWVCTDIEAA